MKSSLKPPQPGHAVDSGTQSATHSFRLPTMSKAPTSDTHRLREPVLATLKLPTLQSLVPLSVPGSGVPYAERCHSALVKSRLPALRQAASAWNQSMYADGVAPGIETA